ncbi:MAG: hypothetical protein AAFY83_14000 [Pseudomonadota bacterium]
MLRTILLPAAITGTLTVLNNWLAVGSLTTRLHVTGDDGTDCGVTLLMV